MYAGRISATTLRGTRVDQSIYVKGAAAVRRSRLLMLLFFCGCRMKRLPSERLHDEVDRELLKEREVIDGVASLLQRVVEQITEQIR